ncbi:unnamed protein product [Bursaphelenchus okinawaensis]|uniref:Uncharacterized protein n=1 Tax=Bursaphelenchus okinawaensis TaxID=465554 RepID=A0A811KA96_9BILA|nr:unnamed protein product [Bursaphelenchus okinawaensis]CAG9097139.1 unnamed protein product [Bursaphelenchus okinawaensis]
MGGLGCGMPFGGGFGGLGGFGMGLPALYSPFGFGSYGGLGMGMPLCCGGLGLGYGGLIGKRSIKESEMNITRTPTRLIFKRRIPLARLRTITFTTKTRL